MCTYVSSSVSATCALQPVGPGLQLACGLESAVTPPTALNGGHWPVMMVEADYSHRGIDGNNAGHYNYGVSVGVCTKCIETTHGSSWLDGSAFDM